MKLNRLAGGLTAVAAFLSLCAAPGLVCAQGSQSAVLQPPRMVAPGAGRVRDPRSTDDLAGLKFTAEQQANIDEIHRRMTARKDVVAKSGDLKSDQKDAMIAGLGRMERGEIVKLLTPEQKKEVLKAHASQTATSAQTAASAENKRSSR